MTSFSIMQVSLGIHKDTFRRAFDQLRTDFAQAILCLLLLFLPLVRVGQLEDSFITPKVALAQALVLALGVAVTFELARRKVTKCRLPLHTLAFLGYVAWGATSLLHARSAALGLFALAYLITFFALHVYATFAIRNYRAGWAVLASGILAASLTSLWTLAEDFTKGQLFGAIMPRLPDWRGYLAAGLGNSGHIAGFVGMFFPAALIAFLATPSMSLALAVMLFLMIPCLIVTWSVGSTGATFVALLFCAVVALQRPYRSLFHWKRLGWVVAFGIGWLLYYFLPVPGNPHKPSLLTEAFGSQRWVEGWPTRVAIWKTTWQMILGHFWQGVGLGNFTLEYVRQIVPSLLVDPHLRLYAGAYTNEAHNEYLQVWAETGFPGLALYLTIFLAFLVRAHRLFRSLVHEPPAQLLVLASTAGVLVFALDSLMSFPLRLPAHFAALAVFLALPSAIGEDDTERLPSALSRGWRVAPSVCLALSAGLAMILLASGIFVGRRVVAEFYFKQGRVLAETLVPVAPGQAISPWSAAESAFRQGVESLIAGRPDQAKQFFAGASEILHREPFPTVEDYWRRALAWDPRYTNASSRYGALLLMRGNYAEAQRVLEQTLLDLEAFEVHERLGFAHYFLGNKERAILEWDLCRQRRPAYAEYYRELIRMAEK
jgi:O-antigen ligase